MTAQTPDGRDATRARDADRNLAIELIDAAYSDGQLSTSEREERCDRVMTAETLGELRVLTRDLQAPVVAAAPRHSRRRLVPIVVAAVVAVGVVVGGGVVMGNGDDPESPKQQEAQSAGPPNPEPEQTREADPPEEKARSLKYSFTVRGVENLVTLYRKEFGTTKGVAFGFDRKDVIITRRANDGRFERWGYVDRHFVLDGYYPDGQFEPGSIDIANLNVKAMFRNLERVKDRVGLERFPHLGVTVVVASGQKGTWLVAGDDANCQADWMTLDGNVEQTGTACPLG